MNDMDNMNNPVSTEDEIQDEIFNIEVRLQEIDAELEHYEDVLMEKEEEILEPKEVEELRNEYKELKKRRKNLLKQTKKSIWDTIPLWMGIYAIFQFIFSFWLFLEEISRQFTLFMLQVLEKIFTPGLWTLYTLFFLIPFLSLLASTIILLKLKNKNHKKIFAIIFGIHGIETLVAVGLMISLVV
ncbi:MAG: coiled-coil domain-containing protein 22 [Acholeplasmataceae bacterium]|nr:coiled-coil domain-containing protein 22 [Acholeplasmataceae bacterium]